MSSSWPGRGTIGLEILDQLPDADAVIVPVGGGGLIAGVAMAVKSLRPEVKVYGVQAAGAASMYNAFRDKTYETLDRVDTFADGIAVKTPGEQTFALIEQYVDDIVTVSEDEIAAAILSLMENQKLVAEGAGATPVAAALFGKLPIEGKKTVCLISGRQHRCEHPLPGHQPRPCDERPQVQPDDCAGGQARPADPGQRDHLGLRLRTSSACSMTSAIPTWRSQAAS